MFTSSTYNNVTARSNRATYKDSLPSNYYSNVTVISNPDLLWQMKASRERAIGGLNSTTTQDQLTAPSHLESIAIDDGSVVCGDPFLFPFPKKMKSLTLHHQTPAESPAKVFAKLKSQVHRQTGERIQTEKDSLSRVKDKQGPPSIFLRKRKEDIWVLDKTKGNRDWDFHHDEAEALTLSPIQSPRKSLSHPFSEFNSKPVHAASPVKDTGRAFNPINGYTPTKRPVRESLSATKSKKTAMSHPINRINEMTCRTPVKGQTPHQSSQEGDRERFVLREQAADDSKFLKPRVLLERLPLMSPAKMFADMKERVRKRKREPHESYEARNATRELRNRGHSGVPQQSQASMAVYKENMVNNTSMEVCPSVTESSFSPNLSEANPCQLVASDSLTSIDPCDDAPHTTVKQRPVLAEDQLLHGPPRASGFKKQLHIALDKLPLMSPAKMFALLKEREMQKNQLKVDKVSSCTRGDKGCSSQPHDEPSSTTCGLAEVEDDSEFNCPVPVNRSRLEADGSPSEESSREDVPLPAFKPRPALVEDPLFIESPRISFPKKRQAVFTRNTEPPNTTRRWASEVNRVYMRQWCLRHNRHGLYVEGILRDDNTPWHSNIIVERTSKSQVKTVSGKTYVLIDKMKMDVDYGIPKWLLSKFCNGFPSNWKMYYEKFLSESKNMQAEGDTKGRSIMNQTASVKPANNHSVQQSRPRRLKPCATSPPAPSHSLPLSGAKMSRSGRIIKPPLEYWKGGRVSLDVDMNVTIHKCYDTTISMLESDIPDVTRRVPQQLQTPARDFLHCNEGQPCSEPTSRNESSVPLRKVKTPHRSRNRSKAILEITSSRHTELPENTATSGNGNAEEQTLATRRSNRKRPNSETAPCPELVCPSHVHNRRHKTKKPNPPPDTGSSTERVVPQKRHIPARAKPAAVHTEESQSDEDFTLKRKQKGKRPHRKGKNALDESQSSQSPVSSEESVGVSRNNNRALGSRKNKRNTSNKTPLAPPPSLKIPQSSKTSRGEKSARTNILRPQDRDEDRWTDAELVCLQEAMASCPKHTGNYWVNVAMMVGTRSAEECQKRHTCQGRVDILPKKAKKSRKKEEPIKEPEPPKITARVGTLKRKEQVRQFMEAMPKEDHDDAFTSAVMQSKRFQMPSMSPSGKEHGFMFSDQEPITPGRAGFPTVKTPQCLHITPGMIGSVNRKNDDNYIFQLQKRMKRNQVNKHAPSLKGYTPTPSVKRAMKRCSNSENDSFVVWEMFPENEGTFDESGEEDFYFSDDN